MKKILIAIFLFAINSSVVFAEVSFTDVPYYSPYAKAINYVENNGIVNGYSDGTYRPDQKINRAEFVKILIASNYEESDIDNCLDDWEDVAYFSDVPVDSWFGKYICWGAKIDFLKGYYDGTFRPSDNINFSEAAKLLSLVYGYIDNEETTDPWFKEFIDFIGSRCIIPTTIKTFDKQITRGEMAEMIARLNGKISDSCTNYTTYDEIYDYETKK